MNRSETGEYLYMYFRKLSASFQSSFYKAAITCEIEDVHKARVDVKKMNALFILFETISPGFCKESGGLSLFKNLFRSAGTIRETQLMLLFLDRKNDPDPVLIEFTKWLAKRNRLQVRQYVKAVMSFDKKGLKDLTRSVRKFMTRVSTKQIVTSSWDMIHMNSIRVNYFLSGWSNPKNIHRIRQNIKDLTAIVHQVSQVAPDAGMDQIRLDLTRMEIVIGEWHDKVVIIDAMERFMKTTHYANTGPHRNFLDFKEHLNKENEAVLEKLKPEVEAFVALIKSLTRKRYLLH
ncbi:MAG: CHAD domain-containing protein [Bacteroidetes bacterium]|nr:CHAD domain-containing protein [Bacteroidota bacterium]